MVRQILIILFTVCAIFSASAQAVNEVTLVVSGEGATKEDATHNALRSAIEQAFGTFVSANTSILNDELIKDEIVSVSSGNIQKYNEVGSVALPNGNTSITLEATVSIGKLVSYAQSKGSECEFAGATFGSNLKLIELNKRNTEAAINNLLVQLEAMVPYIYDYDLEVSDPKINGDVTMTVSVKSNANTKAFGDLIASTLKAVSINEKQMESMEQIGVHLRGINIMEITPPSDNMNYIIPLWFTQGSPIYHKSSEPIYYFHSFSRLSPLADKFEQIFCEALYDFQIEDNIGNTYKIQPQMPRSKDSYIVQHNKYGSSTGKFKIYLRSFNRSDTEYDDLYCWGVQQGFVYPEGCNSSGVFILPFKVAQVQTLYTIKTTINIPIDKLISISNFQISHKPEKNTL